MTKFTDSDLAFIYPLIEAYNELWNEKGNYAGMMCGHFCLISVSISSKEINFGQKKTLRKGRISLQIGIGSLEQWGD